MSVIENTIPKTIPVTTVFMEVSINVKRLFEFISRGVGIVKRLFELFPALLYQNAKCLIYHRYHRRNLTHAIEREPLRPKAAHLVRCRPATSFGAIAAKGNAALSDRSHKHVVNRCGRRLRTRGAKSMICSWKASSWP
jgi:hypothetical protein